MSGAASDEEAEELVAALDDEELSEDDDPLEDKDEDADEARHPREELSGYTSSDQSEDEDENDELHIAARAGIRLLEENMHFREEVLRLNEQIAHLKDERAEVQRTLNERDEQVVALTNHLRESILENQSVLMELNRAKEQLRDSQHEVTVLQEQLSQRSPRKRTNQRLSPRRSALISRPLLLEQLENVQAEFADAVGVSETAENVFEQSVESPTATTTRTNESGPSISPTKLDTPCTGPESPTERRQSQTEFPSSPRRRPTLARLRELETKYEDEHQRCGSLRLELNFAQRRITELKAVQNQLQDASQELESATARLAEMEKTLAQTQVERTEEHALIQSLRQTVAVYEQLNDPRQRGNSTDHGGLMTEALQQSAVQTAEGSGAGGCQPTGSMSPTRRNEQFEKLDRAAEMIDGRFNLREENERLLQQLNSLTEQILALQSVPDSSEGEAGFSSGASGSVVQRQRYLEQQVAVLHEVLRRFRLEWQHAHDARVSLEDEKAALLMQLGRLQAKVQRTRSASVISKAPVVEPLSPQPQPADDSDDKDGPTVKTQPATSPRMMDEPAKSPTGPEDDDVADEMEAAESDVDEEEAFERRQWERTQAICDELLKRAPSSSSASSKEEEAENEMLCFALLRRLVDSWTTDKPKRMKLHDWLTNAIRGTGVRKPLYLHELSSEIAMGFQTLMVPILQAKFGVQVNVEKRLRNVIVTDLKIQVLDESSPLNEGSASRVQRVYHSLLAVIDGETGNHSSGDEYQQWMGNALSRRASRSLLAK